MKCMNCNREMVKSGVHTNIRSKYCNNKCKQAAYRNNRNTKSVTDVTVTETVTKPPEVIDGKCGIMLAPSPDELPEGVRLRHNIKPMTAAFPDPNSKVFVTITPEQ